ncbi:MAG: hypothetical protein COU06_02450 [Candidatus Harrisonbacteria bacterium CG10_big_fil_rev_8_21_14_0_10_38_8]|uniref:Uncharacterized protein n=1 Tax=Candidatus Harrisonbacteria bacterium CG10_big_fil_rev_8_21_14_0_10_38_8 TaxID=1974582 RepID=A0A2M6WJK5_9BACT|nr:MAG: hypothetical protein COU06_02450 [Candidatus Harrisonbacteria bacterium CG10_big_fil_rev_8_21_14_0_10_38_8]
MKKWLTNIANQYPVILQALLFGLVLLIAVIEEFSLLPTLVFFLVSIWLYRKNKPVQKTPIALLSTLIISPILINIFNQERGLLPLIIILSFIFFLILGISTASFNKRKDWYYLLVVILFYLASIIFFSLDRSTPLFLESVLFAVFTLLTYREFFRVNGYKSKTPVRVILLVISLTTLQLTWILLLMPIHFTVAASITTLYAFTILETLIRHLQLSLTPRYIRLQIMVFVLLTIILLTIPNFSITG